MGTPLGRQLRVGGYIARQKLMGRKRYPRVLMHSPVFFDFLLGNQQMHCTPRSTTSASSARRWPSWPAKRRRERGRGKLMLRAIILAACLGLASLPAGASTNTYYEGACKYIDAQGEIRFDGVCFITFAVQNSYFGEDSGQPAGYAAGAAFYSLLFANGTRAEVVELTWYRTGDPAEENFDPRDAPQGYVNRKPATIAARPFEPGQQGPATMVAVTGENEVFIFDACGEACPESQYEVNGRSLWELREDGWLEIRRN